VVVDLISSTDDSSKNSGDDSDNNSGDDSEDHEAISETIMHKESAEEKQASFETS
jgi:hypothetical protein